MIWALVPGWMIAGGFWWTCEHQRRLIRRQGDLADRQAELIREILSTWLPSPEIFLARFMTLHAEQYANTGEDGDPAL
jgi:hypothetical protein